ncbi:hypothetical protein [Saccharopolyspora elongata]|uniref:hypothetical protein n=1 Tax=Saccharopolyspora elongata TaxID=2530387 RepID=UPI0014052E38|nr:hypothetical protein [Saccharopolyspora elongata]
MVWVPSRLTAAHRKLHAATGAKSDPVDAAAAAHAAIATPGLDRHRGAVVTADALHATRAHAHVGVQVPREFNLVFLTQGQAGGRP